MGCIKMDVFNTAHFMCVRISKMQDAVGEVDRNLLI